jgi:hypothetical protein
MSFGRNPHVAKAEAEEQKAATARDARATALAWREAARQWERAADKETDAKRRVEYAARADAARSQADGEAPTSLIEDAPPKPSAPVDPNLN